MILFIETELNDLRERIKGIDYSIVSLIAQRIKLARKVGRFKQEQKLPIRNFQVERKVYERIHDYAKEFELDTNYIHPIFEQIIASSVNVQLEDLVESSANITASKFLLVGGGGKMGKWFHNFLLSSGYYVDIVEPNQVESQHVFNSLPPNIDSYDFIGILTPLHTIPQNIDDVISINPNAVIFEIGSLKSQVITRLKNLNTNVKLISCHPLFGPEVKNLDGRNMIICDNDLSMEHFKSFNDLFRDTSLNIVSVPLEEHDRIMLYTLSLSHFINLLHGQILKDSNIQYEDLENFASTTFLKQINTTREVYSENPELYFSIQNMNSYRSELLDKISSSFEILTQATSDDKFGLFKELMSEVNEYLNFKK